ncbi:MAG: endonuclease, partial [Candidatus Eisenbacteria bacterium]|nr:endonuclease [Candidatus Eisenbacteria bacterium]
MRTMAILLLVFTLPLAQQCSAQTAVLISELCDPRLNYLTDRFIEIYNAGATSVDLTDWSLVAVGNSVDIFTWNLSGTIDAGEALAAGDQNTVIYFPVDFPDDAWSNNNSTWNGKVGDGAKLLNASAIIVDYVVVPGTAFENMDYVRNPDIVQPSVTYEPSEWTATAVDYPTQGSPGSHYVAPPLPGPSIDNIVIDPAAPLPDQIVDVYADVTDTVAIASVSLLWGTSQFSITNEIGMSLDAGDTYVTDSPIPAQTAGTTVYLKVQATNNLPATSVSDAVSYSLPYTVTISEIQGGVSTSPYAGYAVMTHGVVTGVFGAYFTLQEGPGAWNGLWARGLAAPALGDSVTIRGTVREDDGANTGNTMIVGATVVSSQVSAAPPEPVAIQTVAISMEDYEGVLVSVTDAVCTNPTLSSGEWEINDGTGAGRVDDFGYAFEPTAGTAYDVTAPVIHRDGTSKLEPRDGSDVVWAGDSTAPAIYQVYATTETTLVVTFSEDVDQTSSGVPTNYDIDGLTVTAAVRDDSSHDQAHLTVSSMSPLQYTLIVSGVEDLYSNVMDSVSYTFDFVDVSIPADYYDSAEGLVGEPLRAALHDIIKNHTPLAFTETWVAFRTTDDKPNGKVWDIYSDVPGGTPPYEYTFGVDEGGVGGVEGTGYNREHSWPSSWFGGEAMPMYSDMFSTYPTDNFVNNQRGSDPYGEVDAPTWTSLNGSRKGNCSYPGYAGPAFEPIDEYKGDLARSYFYFTTRYYTEDASWSSSAMTSGADILPWAVDMLLEWHLADPVSWKEIERNGTIYWMQFNRNPFIDHPEFASAMYVTTGVGQSESPVLALHQSAPNPFGPATTIRFTLGREAGVSLRVFDVAGRLVRVLAGGTLPGGDHEVVWDGRDENGREAASGVYFYSIRAVENEQRRKAVLL